MTKLFSSLLIDPVGSVYPRFDKSILFTVKIIYIIHQISIRTVVGKRKRDILLSDADKRLHYKHILSGRFSPSFYIVRTVYTSRTGIVLLLCYNLKTILFSGWFDFIMNGAAKP